MAILSFDNDINMTIITAKKVLVERNGNQIEIDDAYWFSRSIVSIWKGSWLLPVPFVVGAAAEELQTLIYYLKDITHWTAKSTRYFDQIAAITESNKGKTIPLRFYAIKKTENIT
jgi:hypothetical protein